MVENRVSFDPELIQGGMGVGVSSWKLARAVAQAGKKLDRSVLGVVSGTGLPILMIDGLQHHDPDTIRAVRAFPIPEIGQAILDIYIGSEKLPPKPQFLISGTERTKTLTTHLSMVSNFVEVWLAKEGHDQPIGINYLEKLQPSHLSGIFGAMLAGVNVVLMGAGMPNQVPAILDKFSQNQPATYNVDVEKRTGGYEMYEMSFDPFRYLTKGQEQTLQRPEFLAIISSHALAQRLARKVAGVNGFVVEGPLAGGHNAPARSKMLNELGEPIYGEKDKPDLDEILQLRLPYWLAGDFASPEKLEEAKKMGAVGIQVGSAFALSDESSLDPKIKRVLRKRSYNGDLVVITSAVASPSGYPFQVAQVDGTLSDPDVYKERERDCIYGYLVKPFMDEEGEIDFRCPAEPVDVYVSKKGGKLEDTVGRQCICCGLVAAVNRAGEGKPAIVTLGKNQDFVHALMDGPDDTYSAEDVVRYILTERA